MKQYILLFLIWIQVISALPATSDNAVNKDTKNLAIVESTMVVAPRMLAEAKKVEKAKRLDLFMDALNQKHRAIQRRQLQARHVNGSSEASAAGVSATTPEKAALTGEVTAPPPGASIEDLAGEIGTNIGRQLGSAIGTAVAGEALGGKVGESVGTTIGTRIGKAIGGLIDGQLAGALSGVGAGAAA